MKFKSVANELEFWTLNPSVKEALTDLDVWSKEQGFPEVVVTHCLRTPEEQETIYWKRLMRQNKVSEEQARRMARAKFSWHLVGCAVDIRNRTYTKIQLDQVMFRLRKGRSNEQWEILSHDVGRGEHIHVGIKDSVWRSNYRSK